jgi:hypothetical protein
MMTGAAHLPGALLPLLVQTALLWNLLFSSIIFGTRYGVHDPPTPVPMGVWGEESDGRGRDIMVLLLHLV